MNSVPPFPMGPCLRAAVLVLAAPVSALPQEPPRPPIPVEGDPAPDEGALKKEAEVPTKVPEEVPPEPEQPPKKPAPPRAEPPLLVKDAALTRAIDEASRVEDPLPRAGLTRDVLDLTPSRRVGEAARRLPGMMSGGPAGETRELRLRGLDKEFTRFQLDGVQLPGGGEKREFEVHRLPTFLIDDIRVIRNPTAEYESDGLAGRVAASSRGMGRVEEDFLRLRLGVGSISGSDGTLDQQDVAFGWRPTEWFGLLGACEDLYTPRVHPRETARSDGDLLLEDDRENERSRNLFLRGAFVYGDGFGELRLEPLHLRSETRKRKDTFHDFPGTKATERENEAEDKVQVTRGFLIGNRHDLFGEAEMEERFGRYTSTEEKEKTKYRFKEDANGDFPRDLTEREHEDKGDRTVLYGAKVTVPFDAIVEHVAGAGVDLRFRERERNKTRVQIDRNGVRKDATTPRDNYGFEEDYAAIFIQDEAWISPTTSLLPGARYEVVRQVGISGTGVEEETTFRDLNPSLHFLQKLGKGEDLALKAAISRVLHRPKFDELAPYEEEKGDRVSTGNPGLKPARARALDIGIEWAPQGGFLGVNWFHRRVRGLIEEVDTGEEVNGKPVYRFENVGDGYTGGFEFEQRLDVGVLGIADLPKGLSLWANQTFLESSVRDSTGLRRPFKEQPEWLRNYGIDYTSPGGATTIGVVVTSQGSGREYKSDGGVKKVHSQAFLGISARHRVARGLHVFVEATNVLGEDKIETETRANGIVSRRREGGLRTVMFGIEWNF